MATNYPYTTGIPVSTDTPAQDQPGMQINCTSINQILSTDHLTFGTATGNLTDGMHTVIHLQDQIMTPPAAILGAFELWSQLITFNATTDDALFVQTGKGTVIQMTTSANTVAKTNGYTFLPGGVILQWGTSTTTGTTTGVTYPLTFPTKEFIVMAQPYSNSSPSTVAAQNYWTDGGSAAGFTFFYPTFSGGNKPNFLWFAIGN